MPNLPTLTVPAGPVWDRLMAAFNNSPTEYKAWLKTTLQSELQDRETNAITEKAKVDAQTRATELQGFLDGAS